MKHRSLQGEDRHSLHAYEDGWQACLGVVCSRNWARYKHRNLYSALFQKEIMSSDERHANILNAHATLKLTSSKRGEVIGRIWTCDLLA